MIKTYDFLLTAKRDKNFRAQIDEAISRNIDCEICTDIHRLTFSSKSQTVAVAPKSNTSPFKEKIVSKRITYQALIKMLNDEWNSIASDDITDL